MILLAGIPSAAICKTGRFSPTDSLRRYLFQLLSEHLHLLIQPSKHLLHRSCGLRAHFQEQDRLVAEVVEEFVFQFGLSELVVGYGYNSALRRI